MRKGAFREATERLKSHHEQLLAYFGDCFYAFDEALPPDQALYDWAWKLYDAALDLDSDKAQALTQLQIEYVRAHLEWIGHLESDPKGRDARYFGPEVPDRLEAIRDHLESLADPDLDRMLDAAGPALLYIMADDAFRRLPQMVRRLVRALDYLMPVGLPADASKYLQRVGRLWVAGFPLEAVVLARAGMEVALKDAWERHAHERGTTGSREELRKLDELIDALYQVGRLSLKGKEAAHSVRKVGNNILHERFGFNKAGRSVPEVLENLRIALQDLNRPTGS